VSKDVFQIAPNYQAGKDMMEAFRETFHPAGGRMLGEDYPKLGETDYAPYLTKIKQSGAKAVFAFLKTIHLAKASLNVLRRLLTRHVRHD
jgi:branched-chain amino acid transport system substrate-binding protein